ncbi:MAG: glycoside hydrolase family 2 TIM barrel-domain containing protein [Rikenellaceae bacterium]
MKKTIFVFLFALSYLLVAAQQKEVSISKKWHFSALDSAKHADADFDDSKWQVVNLPHDYSAEGEYNIKNSPQNSWLPISNCWYRKSVRYDKSWKDNIVYIWFDGAYMDSELYVNGTLVGNRPYGFISFYYDITKYIKKGDNQLSLHIRNEGEPTSRFYHGSSVYGDAKIIVAPKLHIPISGGVFYNVESIAGGKAKIKLITELQNDDTSDHNIQVISKIYDNDAKLVGSSSSDYHMVKCGVTDSLQSLVEFDSAKLWSVENPYLYLLSTQIEKDGKVVDQIYTKIGVRTIDFKAATGFYLNGKNIKLKGTCEHMEMMPVGQAVPKDMWLKRITLLKEMGCNAIRTAHNPFAPIFYQLCDELGMLVVDEIFDGWKRKGANDYGGRFFKEWWKKDVGDWIRRDRNHPSIVMWSIGNETGHGDDNGLTGWLHRNDYNSRPTTGGNVLFGVDVSGFTGQGGMPGALEKFHADNPARAIVLTEVPHTIQTRGFYRVPTWWRDKGGAVNSYEPYGTKQIFFDGHPLYCSSYDNSAVRITARTCWKRTRDTPWIIGEFRWTGYECFGEAQFMGIEFPKRSYNAGVIDFAGFPKDHYYFYQSQWSDKPMVHILPHWTHRYLTEGTVVPVVAYSNCDEVELLLNGRSLGRQKMRDLLDFVWNVPYQKGEIKAVGYNNGEKVVVSSHKTAGDPMRIVVETQSTFSKSSSGTVSYVDVRSVDQNNNFVPWCMNKVKFVVEGDVDILGFENGNPVDSTRGKSLERRLFYGLARGFFQNNYSKGDVSVKAAAILGDTIFMGKTKVAVSIGSVMLRGGEKEKNNYSIYYTLDGSEPTKNSKLYENNFYIDKSTTIKCKIFDGDKELFYLDEKFVKGSVPIFIDPMLQTDEVLKDRFKGPFDSEMIGRWSGDKCVFQFEKSGVIYEFNSSGYPREVGQWWYDFPADRFENPDTIGKGEIRWNNKTLGESVIIMDKNNIRSINIKRGDKVITLTKND